MSRTIEILARGAYVQNGALLLCHTENASNTYLPGGHVEFDESATESLRREIEEELGCHSTIGRFLGALEHRFLQKGRRHCEINLVFEMSIPTLTPPRPPPSRESHLDFRWIALDKLHESDLEPKPLRKLLPEWLTHDNGIERWESTY